MYMEFPRSKYHEEGTTAILFVCFNTYTVYPG